MAARGSASRRAPPFIPPSGSTEHRPEQTLLYRLVAELLRAHPRAIEALLIG